jgi:hypothetical protein
VKKLKLNFKNLYQTQFSELRNYISSVEMYMWDTECIACFVKIGQGIQELMGGGQHTDRKPESFFREVV